MLTYLGSQLSNKIPVELYQRHRDTEDWTWKSSGEPVNYAIRTIRRGKDSSQVALLLSLSGTIHLTTLPSLTWARSTAHPAGGGTLSMTARMMAVVMVLMLIGSSALAKWSMLPAQACQLLAHLPGMRTGPYRHMEAVGWTCLTPYYVLHPASIDAPNNLAYYVDGTAEQAMELKLVLNVYVKYPRETAAALAILARYTAEMTRKALGQPLPAAATARIQQGRVGEWKLGAAIVQTRREDWPTQKGYTLYVHIK